jgi:hypothetical protein
MDAKVVLLHGFSREETLQAMRAIKAAARVPEDIAFAMTTESNRKWTVEELIEHVAKEHEFMKKARKPQA